MTIKHDFKSHIIWTGNTGNGAKSFSDYKRTWDIASPGKQVVHCSNDPRLGGDATKFNPEDLLISALSSCHMLWYLHLASEAGIVVTEYSDKPLGHGESQSDASGQFVGATLRPYITLGPRADLELAEKLHHEVHKYCFIARSINFPVTFKPTFMISN